MPEDVDDKIARNPRRAAPGVPALLDLQVRAAWLYYVESLTQEQIARDMAISRAKVVRLLSGAREHGVVTIQVGAEGGEQVALERRLIERFGLDEAIVIRSAGDQRAVAGALGEAAGAWLAERLRDGMSIGIGWGETLSMCVRPASTPHRHGGLSVISLLGGMTHSRGVNPSAVARRLADALGADCYQLTAPLVVADEALRDALWHERGLHELRARARAVDLALVSVGDVSERATLFREGVLPRSQLATLREAGAVGDVLCHFLDRDGRIVDHPVERRVVALSLEELQRIPRVAIVSGGLRKVEALRAALRATRARFLITDDAAARGLLSS